MNNTITINLDKCFECGEPKEHMHHVIPKSKGGKKMIPLCAKCHGLVHGKDFVKHRTLLLEGIKKAKELGKYKGRIKGTTDTPQEVLYKHKKIIDVLKLNPNLSLRKIAKLVNDNEYNVSYNTVKKVKTLFLSIEKIDTNVHFCVHRSELTSGLRHIQFNHIQHV